ncbi:hypothetical protein [Cellulomonas citrea]|uniref:hypothetical protein n=1 Tax=Cellulomonas citrea TaxID=1909423 RepID=UPI0013576AE7|nr:hypothetical protein [Cellulomonas citrea]
MLKRLVVAAIGAVGVLVAGLGVASATLWRADDVLVASLTSDLPYVATAPGVIDMAGAPATVTARTADGHPVVVAVGRDTDVLGWLGQDEFTYVTGLSGWHTFAGRTGLPTPAPSASGSSTAAPSDAASASASDGAAASTQASASPTPTAAGPVAVADPTGSDMWVAQDRGDGAATVSWPSQPGRWSVLAASPDGTPVTVSIAWPRTVTTPYLWPGVVVGGLLVLLALALAGRMWWSARRPSEDWTDVESPTGVEPEPASAPKTRRELREAERLAAAARSGAPRTGALRRVTPGDAPQPPSVTGSHPTVSQPAVPTSTAPTGTALGGTPPTGTASTEAVADVPVEGARPSRGTSSPARSLLPRRRRSGTAPEQESTSRGAPETSGRGFAPSSSAGGSADASASAPSPASGPSSSWRPGGFSGSGPAGPWRPVDPPTDRGGRPVGGAPDGAEAGSAPTPVGRHGGGPSWAPQRPQVSAPVSSGDADPSTPTGPGAPGLRAAPGAAGAPAAPQRRSRPSWLGADRGNAPEPTSPADGAPGVPPVGRSWPAPTQQAASPVLPPTVRADAWRRTWGIAAAEDAPETPDSDAPETPEEGR